jgi:hypothetical protein
MSRLEPAPSTSWAAARCILFEFVPADKLAQNMREMQLWLDQAGFVVMRYNYGLEEVGPLIDVKVEFPLAEEAEIFCNQFEGELL